MRPIDLFGVVLSLSAAAACGGGERTTPAEEADDIGPDGGAGCRPIAGGELCSGGVDEDCDRRYDCDDSDCDGDELCAAGACGALDMTEGTPLALPDGEGSSYMSSIDFTGFSEGQTVAQVSDVLGVCVVMEHSWLRDLQIEIACPSGQEVVLQAFLGKTGDVLYMGDPNIFDFFAPSPGTGAEYCWRPDAVNAPMLAYADETGVDELPAGDYQAIDPFSNLIGCSLNGDWTIKVTDLWAEDNGFIFEWGVEFNPGIVADCDDWPIE